MANALLVFITIKQILWKFYINLVYEFKYCVCLQLSLIIYFVHFKI